MTHTPLDKIHVEATNLILKQRGKIKRLEAEKADLLEALENIEGVTSDIVITGIAKTAIAKARP